MEEKINKHFCIQPFVNVTTRITGQNNVCCNTDYLNSNIVTESPTNFFNSEYVKNLRSDLLEGKKRKDCALCQYQETHNQFSQRQKYNEYYYIKNDQSRDYYKNIVKKLKFENLKKPLYVEMHVSNLCNLKCLTCNETDSSQFHAENKILGISKHPKTNFTKFVVNTTKELENVIHTGLLFLDIRGGETLMVPEIKNILSKINHDVSKNITLKIQTNGTVTPDETWTNIFKKFKNTKVNVSIDAFGDKNHYIRYPSNWTSILNTINYLKENNIKFIINTVVSNLNILYLDQLFDWIIEENYLNYFYILENPLYYRPNNLPKECLELALSKLSLMNRTFKNTEIAESVDRLIKLCNNSTYNDVLWKRFSKEINMRDKIRNVDIQNVLPEIADFLIK